MKTSNIIIILGIIALMVIATFQMSKFSEGVNDLKIELTGTVIDTSYTVSNFNTVDLRASADVILIKADEARLEVQADRAYLPLIEVNNDGKNLEVKTNGMFSKSAIKMKLYYTNLTELKLSRGNKCSGDIIADSIQLDMGAGAQLNSDLQCQAIVLKASAGARAKLSGQANMIDLSANAGANVETRDMTTDVSKVSASSGAAVKLGETKELDASASSGGRILYQGSPTITAVNTSSGGSISKEN